MKIPWLSVLNRMKRTVLRVVLVLFAVVVLLTMVGANARVLAASGRPSHRANMLIVLDTSGSMTGVPGGTFQNSSECGVDCDNGVNCRPGGVQGICKGCKRTCQSDEDCRHGVCSTDTPTLCDRDTDCPQALGTCSFSSGACANNSDCPAQPEICSSTQMACSADAPCPSVGICKYGSRVVCKNLGGSCPDVGTCSTQSSRTCDRDQDCPPASSGGVCSLGDSPRDGCRRDRDCPSTMHCRDSGDSCRSDGDCPLYKSHRCEGGGRNGNSCRSDHDCAGGRCLLPSNPCTGNATRCVLPGGTCNRHSDNPCIATENTCSAPANTCTLPPANTCQIPSSLTDTCIPSPVGGAGPIRMCRSSQVVCTRNSDCGGADLCGPATSRAVIVKRAISKLVMGNATSVNFGLMTFFQDGYFPYFQTSSDGLARVVTVFKSKEQLQRAGCYAWNGETDSGGPSATCAFSGRPLILRASADSRYRLVDRPPRDYDFNFCGESCDLPDRLGRGTYLGSTYEYLRSTSAHTNTLLERNTYDGHDITIQGLTYSYYHPLSNTYNGGHAPPITLASCGSSCSPTCGGRWDEQLAPFLDTSDHLQRSLAVAQAITARMDYAADGGLVTFRDTPTGCTLENDGASTPHASAYHYMDAVKNGFTSPSLTIAADPVPCRSNSLVLITDGAPNGPGDVDKNGNSVCEAAPCSAVDPAAAGCQCRSVLAAYRLRHKLGVNVFVVGFSGDASAGAARASNNNMAKAGGSGAANFAAHEDELDQALRMVVEKATTGSPCADVNAPPSQPAYRPRGAKVPE